MDGEKLYSSWYNEKGLECKVVGPSTKCFCDHLFKYHKTVNGKIKCEEAGCKCGNFYYLPIYGSQDFRCQCKHSYQQHQVNKRSCKACACKSFTSSWLCSCNMKFSQHKTLNQTKAEKESKGQVLHSKQGGVISYSSMLDGADRFGAGIDNQMKKKGMKVKIDEFSINKEPAGRISAWQLYNTPLKWAK